MKKMSSHVDLSSVRKYTMTSMASLEILRKIIVHLDKNDIQGAMLECGVWKGGCVMAMMLCNKANGKELRHCYLLDTFEGMTEPNTEKTKDGAAAGRIYSAIAKGTYQRNYDKWHGDRKWAFCPLKTVQNNLQKIGYPESRTHYVKGDVVELLGKSKDRTQLPESISLLRLDTDFYASTKAELQVLAPLVSKGGVIIVDDYYAWQGSRIATDEYMLIHGKEFETPSEWNSVGNPLVLVRRTENKS